MATLEQNLTSTEMQGRAAIVADRDGVILEWNRAAEVIFGYSAAEAIGRSIEIVVPEEERADHWRGYRRVFALMHYRITWGSSEAQENFSTPSHGCLNSLDQV
jgi:PAS domain S-box-containing protein